MCYYNVIVVLIGTSVAFAAPAVAAEGEEIAEWNEQYMRVWDRSKDDIDLEEMDRLVDKLANVGPENRAGASEELKEQTGLPFEPIWIDSQAKKIIARHKMWRSYLNDLEEAVEEKVPMLLQNSTEPHSKHTLNRGGAVAFIGHSAPHPAFLPLLREIVANEGEVIHVRIGALTAISRIPHDGVIEYLIEQLAADDPVFALRAWEQLFKLTDAGIQGDRDNWLFVQRRYEMWWREHKDEFEYNMEVYLRVRSEY